MKFFKIFFLFACILGSAVVQAGTSRYEVTLPVSSAFFQFPGLDLSGASKIDLTVSTSPSVPGYQLDRMELVFPQANNLIANNFKPDASGSVFYATVNNGWVYRRLIVEARLSPSKPVTGDHIDISVYAATADFFTNMAMPPQGELLVSAGGMVTGVTPNPVADTHWMRFDNEGLSLKLYQRAEINPQGPIPGEGLKLALNWMGQGERMTYLPVPFSTQDYDRFKAVTLNVTPIAGPEGDEYLLEVVYEDESGYRQTLAAGDLRMILNQVYQP